MYLEFSDGVVEKTVQGDEYGKLLGGTTVSQGMSKHSGTCGGKLVSEWVIVSGRQRHNDQEGSCRS